MSESQTIQSKVTSKIFGVVEVIRGSNRKIGRAHV